MDKTNKEETKGNISSDDAEDAAEINEGGCCDSCCSGDECLLTWSDP
jgi:hypothetical protein